MQAVLSPPLFTLFQTLASSGLDVVKYPRSGRPALRRFRFSFVEGGVYLTWAGKFGNQGVSKVLLCYVTAFARLQKPLFYSNHDFSDLD